MKKKLILTAVFVVLAVLVVLFFPIKTKHELSGQAEILSREKEVLGTCQLKIEITELASLVLTYNKTFTFATDTTKTDDAFDSASTHWEWDNFCSISLLYYDEALNTSRLCTLTYPEDLSYAILKLDSNYYFLNNGSDVPYAQLPIN